MSNIFDIFAHGKVNSCHVFHTGRVSSSTCPILIQKYNGALYCFLTVESSIPTPEGEDVTSIPATTTNAEEPPETTGPPPTLYGRKGKGGKGGVSLNPEVIGTVFGAIFGGSAHVYPGMALPLVFLLHVAVTKLLVFCY